MKFYAPDYYKNFVCIADECEHNCCIGWEIDVDKDTLEYYEEVGGEFGKKLVRGINTDTDEPHFILSANERCPFLNENNLCDIILNLGECGLCQICSDHPRFRNFFSDREEIGVGLCCEAACELILTNKEKVKIVQIDDDGEDEPEVSAGEGFFAFRAEITELLQNREKTLEERILDVVKMCEIEFPEKTCAQWAEIFKNLERLDCLWDKKLDILANADENKKPDKEWDIAFEQLLVYFIYRHTPESVYDAMIKERVSFALLGYYVISNIFACEEEKSMRNLLNTARMYSAEIEYSLENIEKLLEIL